MAKITVSVLSPLTDSLGLGSVSQDIPFDIQPGKTTIETVLTDLAVRYEKFGRIVFDPKSKTLTSLAMVFLNRQRIDSSAIGTHLKDGDELALVPPLVGG
jgi:molybdopterin converting factor small subunit